MPDTHAELTDSGQTTHFQIDALLPTPAEKDGLRQLAPTIPTFTDHGLRTRITNTDVSFPPTDAELDSAFGSPATVGAGFLALIDDNGSGLTLWLIASDGTNWWTRSLTKAT